MSSGLMLGLGQDPNGLVFPPDRGGDGPRLPLLWKEASLGEHRTELFSPEHSILLFQTPLIKKHFAKNKVSKILSNFKEKVPIRTYIVPVTVQSQTF